jgi:hypothetical protein
VTICVPHDRRPGASCGDQGLLADATGVDDACGIDACAPGGAHSVPVGLAALRCALDRALGGAACSGERLPVTLSRRLRRARALLALGTAALDPRITSRASW